jgi:[acyl-carrier-protein] S-malonyltransferase
MEISHSKKIVFLFPGQGSQFVGMGKDCVDSALVSYFIKRADEVLGDNISEIMFSGPEEKLNLTENAQPAIFTLSFALFQFIKEELKKIGVDINNLVVGLGHSLGEYTAICAAGAISFEDGVKLVRARGKFMQEAVPPGEGAMLAVMADTDQVENLLQNYQIKDVWIANINSQNQVVVSGKSEGIKIFSEILKSLKVRFVPLRVSAPFHCPLMEPAREKLSKIMSSIEIKKLNFPVISAHTLEFYSEDNVKETLLSGIVQKVNFLGAVKKLVENGFYSFCEVGPGKVLSSLVKKIEPSLRVFSFGTISDIKDFLSFIDL